MTNSDSIVTMQNITVGSVPLTRLFVLAKESTHELSIMKLFEDVSMQPQIRNSELLLIKNK